MNSAWTDDGAPVPIDYGAKITGKIGRYNVGVLQVQTRILGDNSTAFGVPRQQFTVARVKRDVLDRSFIGTMFVNRQGATSAPLSHETHLLFDTRAHILILLE